MQDYTCYKKLLLDVLVTSSSVLLLFVGSEHNIALGYVSTVLNQMLNIVYSHLVLYLPLFTFRFYIHPCFLKCECCLLLKGF